MKKYLESNQEAIMCDAYGLTFYGIQKYLKVEGHLDWVSREKEKELLLNCPEQSKQA